MKRITLLGCAGAGKSTLARELGKLLHIEVIHLDNVYWKPGWFMTPKEEQIPIMKDLVEGESWVIDGNYTTSLDIRLDRSDTVVYMDFPRRVCLWRVMKRTFTYRNKRRPDLTEGCPEKFELEFLKWIWDFNKSVKPRIMKKLEQYKDTIDLIILRSREEVESFKDEIREKQLTRKTTAKRC